MKRERTLMDKFCAYRIDKNGDQIFADFCNLNIDDLTEGDVVIKVMYSTINYKDALAATGKGKILKKYPLVGGIDLSGTVVSSSSDLVKEGSFVAVNSCGLSETRDGGYAEYARIPAEAVIQLPQGISPLEAMQIGTAGYAAALAIYRMEQNGQNPKNGPIIVTGATGGVGSIAIDMLSNLGYEVVALTSKTEQKSYLMDIGARRVISHQEIEYGNRPLEKSQWAGAIDNLGGDTLAWLTRTMNYDGNIASIGLASHFSLNTTVMPFILRGNNLLGINAVDTSLLLKKEIWNRIGAHMKPQHLDRIATKSIDFKELPSAFDAFLNGQVVGRTVVEINPNV